MQFLRASLLISLAASLSGCDEPTLNEKEPEVEMKLEEAAASPPVARDTIPAGASDAVPEEAHEAASEKEKSQPEKVEKKEVQFTEPVLRVFMEGDAIVIEGALKSKIQRDRIENQLGASFSGTRIDNRLELDYTRFPVGWGNRVTDGFLIPYFADIQDPYVEYKEGTITLKGKGTATQSRAFHQLAGIVFQGMFSRNIDNQIVTE